MIDKVITIVGNIREKVIDKSSDIVNTGINIVGSIINKEVDIISGLINKEIDTVDNIDSILSFIPIVTIGVEELLIYSQILNQFLKE